jgi:hypothetical protein
VVKITKEVVIKAPRLHYAQFLVRHHGRTGEGAAASPVCWANKASRAIFASQSGNIRFTVGQYWLIIKINGTNSVNFVGNMLSNRNQFS